MSGYGKNIFKVGDIVKLKDNALELENPWSWNSEMKQCFGINFIVTGIEGPDHALIVIDFLSDDPLKKLSTAQRGFSLNWRWYYRLFEHVKSPKVNFSSSDLETLLET